MGEGLPRMCTGQSLRYFMGIQHGVREDSIYIHDSRRCHRSLRAIQPESFPSFHNNYSRERT
jgi:hypothetical protein